MEKLYSVVRNVGWISALAYVLVSSRDDFWTWLCLGVALACAVVASYVEYKEKRGFFAPNVKVLIKVIFVVAMALIIGVFVLSRLGCDKDIRMAIIIPAIVLLIFAVIGMRRYSSENK